MSHMLLVLYLYRNMITHFRCVFVFGLNAMLFQLSQLMVIIIPKMERRSLFYGNALIGCDIGAWVLFDYA